MLSQQELQGFTLSTASRSFHAHGRTPGFNFSGDLDCLETCQLMFDPANVSTHVLAGLHLDCERETLVEIPDGGCVDWANGLHKLGMEGFSRDGSELII